MAEWIEILPPQESDLGDHDVSPKGCHLQGNRIALLVTGSVAAISVPSLARELRKYGADVQIFVTPDGLKCGASMTALEWSSWPNKVITEITAASEHLSIGKPFDLYLVAPATANTICKVAAGISDTVVTGALASALGRRVPVMMVPSMHGSLHNRFMNHAVRKLREMGVYFVAPYDAYGKHNMQEKDVIVMDVCRRLSKSPVKGLKILVTAGPTPVEIDSVRLITNKFSGKLGILTAEELYRRGANVTLLQSYYGMRPPRYLPYKLFKTFDDYANAVKTMLAKGFHYGVFSAAVADYRPEKVLKGKTPSKGALKNIKLVNTFKVIDIVREQYPDLRMVSFKYEEGKTYDDLSKIAEKRIIKHGHTAVVATDGPTTENSEQVAYIFYKDPQKDKTGVEVYNDTYVGKVEIAKGVADFIEKNCL